MWHVVWYYSIFILTISPLRKSSNLLAPRSAHKYATLLTVHLNISRYLASCLFIIKRVLTIYAQVGT